MATDVERLAVLIEANTRQYERAMVKLQVSTERAVKGSSVAIAGLDAQVASISSRMISSLGAVGLGAGLLAVGTAARKAVGEIGDLNDAAQRSAISAEKLQVLRFALDQTAGNAEDADAAMQKFNVSIGQAVVNGAGPAASAFDKLGIALTDAGGAVRDNGRIFDEVADKLAGIADPSQRAALAAELFGKQAGPEMAILLSEGAAGVADYEQKLRDLGGLLSNDMVAAGDELDTKFKEWTLTLDTLWKRGVIAAGEAVANTASQMQHLSGEADDLFSNPSWTSYLRFLAGDYAGAVAEFFGAPINQVNSGAKGDFAGIKTAAPAAVNPNQAAIDALRARMVGSGATIDFGGRFDPLGAGAGGGRGGPFDLRPQIDASTDALGDFHTELSDTAAAARDFAQGFASDLLHGKSLMDSLGDATSRLADTLLNAGINAAFGGLFGGGGLGGIHMGPQMFASGGFLGPGEVGIVGEKGPELAFGGPRGATIVPGGKAGGGSVSFVTHIDARGAAPGVAEQLGPVLEANNRRLLAQVQRMNADPRYRPN